MSWGQADGAGNAGANRLIFLHRAKQIAWLLLFQLTLVSEIEGQIVKPLPRGPLNKLLTLHIAGCKLTHENIMKTLGERIRELREQHDFSVRELAKKLKLSAAFVSDVELGRRHPSNDVLAKIAAVLETTPDELKKYDARPPVQELRRITASDPDMGFALRGVVDEGVTAEELHEFLRRRKKEKKG